MISLNNIFVWNFPSSIDLTSLDMFLYNLLNFLVLIYLPINLVLVGWLVGCIIFLFWVFDFSDFLGLSLSYQYI